MRWRDEDGVRWLEADLPGARVAFSTRLGGISHAPFDRLNLGALTGDDLDAVAANRRRLAGALGLAAERVTVGLQVHGAELATHSAAQRPSPFAIPAAEAPPVDGHVTDEPGLALLVFVADCLPVALSGPGGVAILHCGWRGLAAGIIERGVEALGGATSAAIGPGIGPCCYDVGEEVLEAFSGVAANASRSDGADRSVLDLVGVAEALLRRAGVEDIQRAGLCTSCEPGLFFSHRRDAGRTGRQAGLVWRTEPEG